MPSLLGASFSFAAQQNWGRWCVDSFLNLFLQSIFCTYVPWFTSTPRTLTSCTLWPIFLATSIQKVRPSSSVNIVNNVPQFYPSFTTAPMIKTVIILLLN